MHMKPPLGSQIQAGHPLAQGRVGHWLMNEGVGPKVYDLSGNRNTGTITGALWVPGRTGPCLSFDGSGDYVSSNLNWTSFASANYTISAWVKYGGSTGTYQAPFGCGDNQNNGLYWGNTWTGTVKARIGGSSGSYEMSCTLPSGFNVGWHLITQTRTGTIGEIYVDGKSLGTGTLSSSPVSENFLIGSLIPTAYFLYGLMDDVKVYNRALSAAEVQQLYYDPFGMFARRPIELWTGAMAVGGTSWTATFNDGLGITDAFPLVCAYLRAVTEVLGLTDSSVRVSEAVRSLSEAMGTTDVSATTQAFIRSLSESVGTDDSIGQASGIFWALAESMGLLDGIAKDETKNLLETIGTLDISTSVQEFNKVLAESLGIVDSTTSALIIFRALIESIGLSDAVASVFVASRVISDAEGITDDIVLGRMIAVADALGITDDVTRVIYFLRTQDDSQGILDSMVRVSIALRTVSNDVGMTDVMSKQFGALLKAAWAFLLLKHRK